MSFSSNSCVGVKFQIHPKLHILLLCRSSFHFFCVNIFTTSSCVGVSTNNTGGSLVDHAFHFLFPHFPTCMFVWCLLHSEVPGSIPPVQEWDAHQLWEGMGWAWTTKSIEGNCFDSFSLQGFLHCFISCQSQCPRCIVSSDPPERIPDRKINPTHPIFSWSLLAFACLFRYLVIMIHDPPVQEVHLVWVVGRSMETVGHLS